MQAYSRRVSRLDRITSDSEVCHGKPVIRRLRYPVADLLGLLASGMSVNEVLADYPDLERKMSWPLWSTRHLRSGARRFR